MEKIIYTLLSSFSSKHRLYLLVFTCIKHREVDVLLFFYQWKEFPTDVRLFAISVRSDDK